jgi:hypothetical protein
MKQENQIECGRKEFTYIAPIPLVEKMTEWQAKWDKANI